MNGCSNGGRGEAGGKNHAFNSSATPIRESVEMAAARSWNPLTVDNDDTDDDDEVDDTRVRIDDDDERHVARLAANRCTHGRVTKGRVYKRGRGRNFAPALGIHFSCWNTTATRSRF
jgi:hypothetical protein